MYSVAVETSNLWTRAPKRSPTLFHKERCTWDITPGTFGFTIIRTRRRYRSPTRSRAALGFRRTRLISRSPLAPAPLLRNLWRRTYDASVIVTDMIRPWGFSERPFLHNCEPASWQLIAGRRWPTGKSRLNLQKSPFVRALFYAMGAPRLSGKHGAKMLSIPERQIWPIPPNRGV